MRMPEITNWTYLKARVQHSNTLPSESSLDVNLIQETVYEFEGSLKDLDIQAISTAQHEASQLHLHCCGLSSVKDMLEPASSCERLNQLCKLALNTPDALSYNVISVVIDGHSRLVQSQNRLLLIYHSDQYTSAQAQNSLKQWAKWLLSHQQHFQNHWLPQISATEWRLKNYGLMIQGIQEQMRRIREQAKDNSGLKQASENTARLLGFIHRMDHDIQRQLNRIESIPEQLNQQIESIVEPFNRQHCFRYAQASDSDVIFRKLTGIDNIIKQYQSFHNQSQTIKSDLFRIQTSLQSIQTLERNEEMTSMSRQQYWFSLILGAMAIMTAIPLIIGEQDGSSLIFNFNSLPAPLDQISYFAQNLTPWFALLAFSGSLILMLTTLLVIIRPRKNQSKLFRQAIAQTGSLLSKLQQSHQFEDTHIANKLEQLISARSKLDELGQFMLDAEIGCRRHFPIQGPETGQLLYDLFKTTTYQWVSQAEIENGHSTTD